MFLFCVRVCVCMCVRAHACTAQHVCGGKGADFRNRFCPSIRGLWGWHSGHQLWYEECLLAQPSCWLKTLLYFERENCIDFFKKK